MFKPVSKESIEKFIKNQNVSFLDLVEKEYKLNVICVVCESDKISDVVSFSTLIETRVLRKFTHRMQTQKSKLTTLLEDTICSEVDESFVYDFVRLIGDEFGYDRLYKTDLFELIINNRNNMPDILIVPVTDEFGVDFYTKNFDNVKFIFVQDNFIIPDENEKCHVMQMYDEFNPNHALVKHYSCETQDDIEQEVSSAIDKLVENDKLNVS